MKQERRKGQTGDALLGWPPEPATGVRPRGAFDGSSDRCLRTGGTLTQWPLPRIGQGRPTSRDSPTLPGERGAAPQAGRWGVTEKGDAIGFHLS